MNADSVRIPSLGVSLLTVCKNGIWILAAVLLSACGPAQPRVSYDYDPAAQFSGFNRYDWAEQPGQRPKDDALAENSLVDERIRQALEQALSFKGFSRTEQGQPDFLVSYHIKTQRHVARYYDPYFYGPFYRFGYGYGPWPYYGAVGAAFPYYEEYQTHDLVLEFVNPQTRKAVWRGVLQDALDTEDDPNTQKANLTSKLQYLLLNFPPSAGAHAVQTTP